MKSEKQLDTIQHFFSVSFSLPSQFNAVSSETRLKLGQKGNVTQMDILTVIVFIFYAKMSKGNIIKAQIWQSRVILKSINNLIFTLTSAVKSKLNLQIVVDALYTRIMPQVELKKKKRNTISINIDVSTKNTVMLVSDCSSKWTSVSVATQTTLCCYRQSCQVHGYGNIYWWGMTWTWHSLIKILV